MTEYDFHVDGELVRESAATVDVRDRGFMYGDGAFETLRVYGGTPFEWRAHVERLERTCETLGFADALPPAADLRDRIDETLSANDLLDASVKLSVTRGVQPGKLTPGESVDPTVVVTVADLPRGGVDGKRAWDEPATASVVKTRRVPDAAIPSWIKTHSYLNGILARLELRHTASDEALLRSMDGFLTEGATSNLFFVDSGTLKTPSQRLPLLPGITRSVVLELAEDADLHVETGKYTPENLETASEVFLTNSTWEIRPVTRVDDVEFERGPVTDRLQSLFDSRVEHLYS